MKTYFKHQAHMTFYLKCLLFSYILTIGLLLLLALFLYRFHLSERTVSISIIMIYVIATFFAGFLSGKKMKSKKFLWGLFSGTLYFLILFLVSVILDKGEASLSGNLITVFLLCTGGGTLGGMVS